MHNMIQEVTRSTILSRTLLDLFVTTMKSSPRVHTGIFLKGLPTPRSAKTSGLLKRMTAPWNLRTREKQT